MRSRARRVIYPPDTEEAYELWNANCGPCALAAILERTLADTRPLLGNFEQRGYMNITDVNNALKSAGVPYQGRLKSRPTYGLVFIQWGGHENKPAIVQYKFTHWIAVAGDTVFEANAPELISWSEWSLVMPALAQDEGWGNGTFSIRSAIELIT